MLVSFDHNFLFVHIPKTGGTSVRDALAPFSHDPTGHWQNRLLKLLGIKVNLILGDEYSYRFRKHDEITTAQRLLPGQLFDSLYKFTFVRNPWDLLASNYSYIRDRPQHKRYRRVSKLPFSEFIQFAAIKGIGFQKRKISDRNGNLLVDHVGFFESFDADFTALTKRLMVVAPLPHLNQTRRADYRELYNSRTRDLVADIYWQDIEAFQYEFQPKTAESGTSVFRVA